MSVSHCITHIINSDCIVIFKVDFFIEYFLHQIFPYYIFDCIYKCFCNIFLLNIVDKLCFFVLVPLNEKMCASVYHLILTPASRDCSQKLEGMSKHSIVLTLMYKWIYMITIKVLDKRVIFFLTLVIFLSSPEIFARTKNIDLVHTSFNW